MKVRAIWLTSLVLVVVHLAVSIGLVLLAAVNGPMPEWGMASAASLTTFPLAEMYDRLLD